MAFHVLNVFFSLDSESDRNEITIFELLLWFVNSFLFNFSYAKCKSEHALSQTRKCRTDLKGHAHVVLHVTVNAATDSVHHGVYGKNEQESRRFSPRETRGNVKSRSHL